jgi:hypothetical protein
VEGDQTSGVGRIRKLSSALPTALKAGAIIACLAGSAYLALHTPDSTSSVAAVIDVAVDRQMAQSVAESLAAIAPAARPASDVWNGIDLGDFRLSDT